MWYFNEEFLENADQHTSKQNGFSPVCARMCNFRLEILENSEPQT